MAALNRRSALAAAVLLLTALAIARVASAAILTVTNLNDSGAGSLRGQIAAASSGDTIDFSVTGTINLMSTLLIQQNLTIIGPASAPGITIDGGGSVPLMDVEGPIVALTLQNLTMAHGFSSGIRGGIDNPGSLTVTDCTFSDNVAGGEGGAILNSGELTVTNSTFSGNMSITGIGGAIESLGRATIVNSTFSGNTAGSSGGGISSTNLNFTVKGTILSDESGGNCLGGIVDGGYNISDDGSCGFSGTSINNSTTLNLDPAGLQNNGGPTQTIALEPNSQAVDFIPIAICAVTSDQRGFPRPDSGNLDACDAGAFELQTGRLAVLPTGERVQIARGATTDTDIVNMAFSFVDFGSPSVVGLADVVAPAKSVAPPNCDAGSDALNGVSVDLFAGTCADLGSGGLVLDLTPWAVHTVAHVNYGTIFQSSPTVPSPETVSVTILQQEPQEDTCGQWSLNIEVAGLDTSALNLGGTNPFALVVEDGDKNAGCFDVTNAIVGSQIDPPKRTVRRGVRR